MNKRTIFMMLACCCALGVAMAFSPYENYLQSGLPTHAMLLATPQTGQAEKLASALKSLKSDKKVIKQLRKKKITNLSCFSKTLNSNKCFFVYFDYSGKKDYLDAVQDFESVAAVKKLNKFIRPRPTAKVCGNHWLQLEWINYIHGSRSQEVTTNRLAMVTRIKPAKEKEYRWLHQTTWPGVVDGMNRCGWRNFSIFLTEMDGTIYEFFYTEIVPSKYPAYSMDKDPTIKRWLKLTDPCQNPLPDADGIWSRMDSL